MLWAFASIPVAGPGQKQSEVSIAGHIATGIEKVVKPIGFNHDDQPRPSSRDGCSRNRCERDRDAFIRSRLRRKAKEVQRDFTQNLRHRWPLPTALAFLAWFVFAPQCISTIAVTRRETNGWKWPIFMVSYLFVLAYIAAGLTYWTRRRPRPIAGDRTRGELIRWPGREQGDPGRQSWCGPRGAFAQQWRGSREHANRDFRTMEGSRR